jgi:hypothetical protein
VSGWGPPVPADKNRAEANRAVIRALLAAKQPEFAAALNMALAGDPRPLVRECVADGRIYGRAERLLAFIDPDLAPLTDNLVVTAVPQRVTFTARQLRPGWTRRDELDHLATIAVPIS